MESLKVSKAEVPGTVTTLEVGGIRIRLGNVEFDPRTDTVYVQGGSYLLDFALPDSVRVGYHVYDVSELPLFPHGMERVFLGSANPCARGVLRDALRDAVHRCQDYRGDSWRKLLFFRFFPKEGENEMGRLNFRSYLDKP